jgi:hypothetical protein
MVALGPATTPVGLPPAKVALAAFCIDRSPVTNEQYKAYIDASSHPNPRPVRSDRPGSASIWTENRFPPEFARQPVVNVTWQSAQAYCVSKRARLPSEAEWEYAARGTAARTYPWGNDPPTPSLANFGKTWEGPRTIAPIAQHARSASPSGLSDMAGNIWQWTSSLLKPMPYDADDGREELGLPGERVARGGSWESPADDLKVTARLGLPPSEADITVGFRCARSLVDRSRPFTTRQGPRVKFNVPPGWSVVEQYRQDPVLKQFRAVDMIGYVNGNLDVALTVRTEPSEGDALEEFAADYAGDNKTVAVRFYRYNGQVYYAMNRPPKVEAKSMRTVAGERALGLVYTADLMPLGLNIPAIDGHAKVKELVIKRGKDMILFSMQSTHSQFDRDERIFEQFAATISWP